MSDDQLTPERAEKAIQFYLHQLGELVVQYAVSATEKATTNADYQVARSRSRVTYRDQAAANGWKATDSIVDDHATLQTEDELRARLLAEAREESTKLALRAAGDKLNGARSLAANLRSVVG